MTEYKRWEIYWAKVGFEETDESKIRPVVILNNEIEYVETIKVTTKFPKKYDSFDYRLLKSKEAGLKEESTARVSKQPKIFKEYIFKKIGNLKLEDIIKIRHLLERFKNSKK